MRFIGFFDYTVILTYLSLISSVFGMTRAIHGDYKLAIFCLAFSGICDAFDGRVARTKKNRTEDEKNFGIQLDSLCDMFCFGIFPAIICYLLGVRGALLVGRIVNHHGEAEIRRGQEKGYFQFGGSTVVLMTEKGRVMIDEDILANSCDHFETIVRMGEKIGCAR